MLKFLPASSSDWREFCRLAAETDHWCLGDEDFKIWEKAFNNEMLAIVVRENEKLVAFGVMAKVANDLACLGAYYVRPEYRGKKIGIKVFTELVEHFKGRVPNMALLSVEDMGARYAQKFGFNKITEWSAALTDVKNANVDGLIPFLDKHVMITDAKDFTNFEKVFKYDLNICGETDRSQYVNEWLRSSHNTAKVATDVQGNVVGYGSLRETTNGRLIFSPLYANSQAICASLIMELLCALPTAKGRTVEFSDCGVAPLKELMEALGETKVEEILRGQFTQRILTVNISRVYSIMDYVLSFI